MINIIPFGTVLEDRFEEGKKYNLVEMIAGIWRVTKKCREHYDPFSYMRYLQGKVQKEDVQKVKDQQPQRIPITKQQTINELLSL